MLNVHAVAAAFVAAACAAVLFDHSAFGVIFGICAVGVEVNAA